MNSCLQCGADRGQNKHFCFNCTYERTHYNGRAAAGGAISALVRSGAIKKASSYQCVDCGDKAAEYDHRDYSKPLEVEPVCRKCNCRRGPAKWVKFQPLKELLAQK